MRPSSQRLLCVTLAACGDPSGPAGTDDTDPTHAVDTDVSGGRVWLPPEAQAVRVSMALRGVHPTAADLQTVRADPTQLPTLVDAWLDDPRFGETVRDLYNEVLLTRSVDQQFPQLGPLLKVPRKQILDAVGDEPLALIERVVLEDRPFTDVVTSSTTVLDAVGAKIWSGHDYAAGGPDEQEVHWTDHRPAAGVLSTNALWSRHPSNGSNYNRGRANVIADALLCEDFMSRDVQIGGDVDLSDPAAVNRAVSTRPECVSCHQALDPLASNLWVFSPIVSPGSVAVSYLAGCSTFPLDQCYPFDPYLKDGGLVPVLLGLRAPGYYGHATADLGDVGAAIAADPRFAQCAARRFWSGFAEVPISDVPFDLVADLQRAFTSSGFNAKALARAAVLSPDFLTLDASDPDVAARAVGPLVVRPFQHARLIEDLTGFAYTLSTDDLICATTKLNCYGDVELATDDVYGFRSMTGGIDGVRVTRPTHTFTPVKLLFAAAIAEEAAGWVVKKELRATGERALLDQVGPTTTDEPTVRAQLASLHQRLYAESVTADSAAVDADWALWSTVLVRTADPDDAWSATLSAMLQAPDLLVY